MYRLQRDLVAGLLAEVRYQLRYNRKINQSEWKDFVKTTHPFVKTPRLSLLVNDLNETGRSEKYHRERVSEMVLRNELGADLWSDDLQDADREDFVGTELTDKERQFITALTGE